MTPTSTSRVPATGSCACRRLESKNKSRKTTQLSKVFVIDPTCRQRVYYQASACLVTDIAAKKFSDQTWNRVFDVPVISHFGNPSIAILAIRL
jgi:hypothetical protein